MEKNTLDMGGAPLAPGAEGMRGGKNARGGGGITGSGRRGGGGLFPPLAAPFLRERRVVASMVGVSLALVGAELLGLPLWGCPFHSATSLDCPGCGLTRGIAALARGRFAEGFELHPFSIFFLFGWLALVLFAVLPPKAASAAADAIEAGERRFGVVVIPFAAVFIFGFARLFMQLWVKLVAA